MKRAQTQRPGGAAACDCGSAAAYAECCGRFHDGPQAGQAPLPEALMRSRYTAYVRDLRAYLQTTWHPMTRPSHIEAPEAGLKWLGLTVLSAPPPEGDWGRVRFVARYKLGGRAGRLEEDSLFQRVDGRWLYRRALAPDEPFPPPLVEDLPPGAGGSTPV